MSFMSGGIMDRRHGNTEGIVSGIRIIAPKAIAFTTKPHIGTINSAGGIC